jgi:para-aminobenzoate synthetase component 1
MLRRLARFGDVHRAPVPAAEPGAWRGPDPDAWTSSLDRAAYTARVRHCGGAAHRCSREQIAAGDVYQANLCRVLSAPLPDPERADVDALTALLARGNPAPYAGTWDSDPEREGAETQLKACRLLGVASAAYRMTG